MTSKARAPQRGYYSFADLLRLGYVRDRSDLSKKIRFEGFPRPIKAKDGVMQARADYPREAVHGWERARLDKLERSSERPEDQHAA